MKINKSVLVICPFFFDYHKMIYNELKEVFENVDLVNERPGNSNLIKLLIRKRIFPYKIITQRYYKREMRKRTINYDFILVIKGESITKKILSLFDFRFPKARKILYLWDSIKNIRSIESKFKYFNRIYSFDFNDIKKYPYITYAYWGYYKKNKNDFIISNPEYDFAFIGSLHSIRPRILNDIKQHCLRFGYKFYFQLYMPSKLLYAIKWIANSDYRLFSVREISFSPISFEESTNIYKKSRVVIDLNEPNQSGFTSRIGELIALNKKILSNNEFLKNEVEQQQNILLWQGYNEQKLNEFVDSEFTKYTDNDLDKFSFEQFIKTIFSEEFIWVK